MRKMRKILFIVLIFCSFCSLSFSRYSLAFDLFSEIFDFEALKFNRVRNEISRGIIIVRDLNKERIEIVKRSFAPWQRLILRNSLNEIIEVEVLFQTRNDFFSPPVKRNFRLKRIVLRPKEEIILLFPINRWGIEERYGIKGHFLLTARSYQKTASGMFCSGEITKRVDLSYRHYKRAKIKINENEIEIKGNKIRFTKWNLRRPRWRKVRYFPLKIELRRW